MKKEIKYNITNKKIISRWFTWILNMNIDCFKAVVLFSSLAVLAYTILLLRRTKYALICDFFLHTYKMMEFLPMF